MSVSASAAEAAVRRELAGSTGADSMPGSGVFRTREVTEAPAGTNGGAARGGRRQRAGVCSRLTTAVASLVHGLGSIAFRHPEVSAGAPHRAGAPERFALAGLPGGPDHPIAALPTANGAPAGLPVRQAVPAELRRDLATAVHTVTGIEQDIRRADDLLRRSRRAPMTAAEWNELCELLWAVQRNRFEFGEDRDERLRQPRESDVPESPDFPAIGRLRQRLDGALGYFHSDAMPWEASVRRVEITPGSRPGNPAVVHSRIVPGTALGPCFAMGYPIDEIADPHRAEHYTHASGLEQTVLADADGQTLFSGLRHGLVHAEELDDELLTRVSGAEAKNLVRALLFTNDEAPAHPNQEHWVDVAVSRLRSGDAAKEYLVSRMKLGACKQTACELVAGALVSDPEKFQRALGGETVDLDLFSVSTISAEETALWEQQSGGFLRVGRRNGRPVPLRIRRSDGLVQSVPVNVRIRELVFELGHVHGHMTRLQDPYRTVSRLLGDPQFPDSGGLAKTGIKAMRQRAEKLRHDLTALGWRHWRTGPSRGADHPGIAAMRAECSGLKAKLELLEKNARTLEDAVRQLKTVWTAEEDWLSGEGQYLQVAARLVLVAHLVGWTPLLSCASGGGLTDELDAEIKSLAAVAWSQGGHLPPFERDHRVREEARREFRLR